LDAYDRWPPEKCYSVFNHALMRYPRNPAATQNPYPLARSENLVRFLGDRDHPAAIEFDGDFQPLFARRSLLNRLACDTAADCAND